MDIRREVLRNVILSQALGPLTSRPGSGRDEEPAAPRPELYLVAGVNSAWQFYDLVDRVLERRGQPERIFDLAYEAQQASVRNRLGGKVNYGQIHLLIPLITAQVLEFLDSGTHDDVDAILERTGRVLHATTESDVESVKSFIELGQQLSAVHRERTGRPPRERAPTAIGRYANVWEMAQDFQSIPTVREMITGYPYSLHVYRFLLHNLDNGIFGALELIHQFLLPEVGRADVVIDFVVSGLYLLLTKHPEGVLFG